MRSLTLIIAAGCALLLAGCSAKVSPKPVDFSLESPYESIHTFAIAPAINLSGSRDFDPLIVSDTIFAEMQQVRGFNVLPLNKTLMAMQRLGVRNIDDPRIAQQIAEMLGADGLVIPAITAYDPYNPPTIGMVLQLYTPEEMHTMAMAPPGATVAIKVEPARPNTPTIAIADTPEMAPGPAAVSQPVSQVNAVFNASNQTVLRELRSFASGRTEYDSALQDQKFIMDADSYLRFVCHAMVQRLIDVERTRGADR